jgi:hypothetical protein
MINNVNPLRLAVKALMIILVISMLILPALGDSIGKLTFYNWLLPGRERLPFSDTPQKAYNLSLFNLEAMFASHRIANRYLSEDEFRVFLMGDSSTWGTLLEPEDTIAGQLNQMGLKSPQGESLQFYNLGYPTLSVTKDLLLLQEAMAYEPDLIIWLVTLESFPADKQLSSPLVENNPRKIASLFDTYQLRLDSYGIEDLMISYWDSTLFSQRRNLADIIRLQLYGVMWGITGIDQYYPTDYEGAARDLSDDSSFHGWQEGEMAESDLALEILSAGIQAAGPVPVIFVNEPILVSEGSNSDVRYNFYYPRWAYDAYREHMKTFFEDQEVLYLDYWNLIPSEEFTNTAIHATPDGVQLLAIELSSQIQRLLNP